MEPRGRLPPVATTAPADLVAPGAVATVVPEISPDVERVGRATAPGRAIRAFGKFVHSVAGSGHRRVLGGKPRFVALRRCV